MLWRLQVFTGEAAADCSAYFLRLGPRRTTSRFGGV
jgi:hypothetical protein